MRTGLLGVVALSLATSACGTTMQQRAATGGLAGLGVGAIVAGPVGAAVGVAAGAAGGAIMPEDATTIANNMLGRVHHAGNVALGMPQTSERTAANTPAPVSGSSMPPGLVKEAQTQLRDQGFHPGAVDGIVGPRTRRALRAYQRKEGLPPTARLDHATMAKMNLAEASPTPPQETGAPAAPPPQAAPASPDGNGNAPDNGNAPPPQQQQP